MASKKHISILKNVEVQNSKCTSSLCRIYYQLSYALYSTLGSVVTTNAFGWRLGVHNCQGILDK
jgi:hypothetical protein